MVDNANAPGPFLLVGGRLHERGYSAIPIMPGAKAPGTKRGGQLVGLTKWSRFSNMQPTPALVDIWSHGENGVGVVGGYNGLVGVDIDTDRPEVQRALMAALPHTDVRKAGAKGETLFYRGQGFPSRSFDILKVPEERDDAGRGRKIRAVDIISAGRQTLLPPTIHPETKKPYVWTGPVALQDIDPGDLPLLPEDALFKIAEALRPFGYEDEVERAPRAVVPGSFGDASQGTWREVNDKAMANLDAWVPVLNLYRCSSTPDGYEAVAVWRGSSSGRPLDSRAPSLRIHRDGIRDWGDEGGPTRGRYTPIDLVMKATDCDRDTALKMLMHHVSWGTVLPFETLRARTITPEEAAAKPKKKAGNLSMLGWGEVRVATAPTVPVEPVPAEVEVDTVEVEEKEAEIFDDDGKIPAIADGAPDWEEARWHNLPGVVGEISRWLNASSRRPVNALAISAAISVIGTLIGRRVMTPTGLATHTYFMGVAPSSGGKEHYKRGIGNLLEAAGAGRHRGADQFESKAGMAQQLVDMPLSLSVMDEFDGWLAKINHRNASSHESGMADTLKKTFSCDFDTWLSSRSASRGMMKVVNPAFSVFGLATPAKLFQAFTAGDVSGGLVNRFLLFSTVTRVKDREPEVDRDVPDGIAATMRSIYAWGHLDPNTLGTSLMQPMQNIPKVSRVEWSGPDVKAMWSAFSLEMESKQDADSINADFYGRAANYAQRIATILACGEFGPPDDSCGVGVYVTADHMRLGIDISRLSIMHLVHSKDLYAMEELGAADMNARVMQHVRAAGAKGIAPRDLMRRMQKTFRRSSDLKDSVQFLTDAKLIVLKKSVPPGGGDTIMRYVIAR